MTIDSRFFELQSRGLSAAQIAAQMDVNVRTVLRYRRRAGLTHNLSPLAGAPASPDRLAQAERLLEDGAPVQEVSRTLRMSPRTIDRHFHPQKWTPEQSGQLAAMTNKALKIPNQIRKTA